MRMWEFGDEPVLYLNLGGGYATVYICQNSQNCILKSFILCKAYFSMGKISYLVISFLGIYPNELNYIFDPVVKFISF